MDNNRVFRFAVLIDSHLLKKWQVDCINSLVNSKQAKLVQLIRPNVEVADLPNKLPYGFRYLERKIRDEGPLEVIDITGKYPKVEEVLVNPIKKKHSTYFQKTDIEALKEVNLDFIVRFGFGILRGDVLKVPSYGIWSFHHGDPKKYRGGPMSFWEIMKKDKVNGAILQQLTNTLDGGYVLKDAHFKTIDHNYKANIYKLLEETKFWPLEIINKLNNSENHQLDKKKLKTTAPIYKIPNNFQVIEFLSIEFMNKVRFHYRQLFRAEKWNVGIIDAPIGKTVAAEILKIDWLKKEGVDKYIADPFPHPENSDLILCEEYDYEKQRGRIVSISEKGDKKVFFEKEDHLSYPFSINHEGKSYLIPENFESDGLKLYEIKANKIIRETLLLDGNWIDPTLVLIDNYWWLFCTQKDAPNEKLYLFYSKDLEARFVAHPQNPVITDVRCARPAGTLFQQEGMWFRLGQNCSKTYGGSVQVKQIETISTTVYKESFIKEIFPLGKSTYNKGIHTFSPFGEKTLVDGKRFYFSIVNFGFQLNRKLKRFKKSD